MKTRIFVYKGYMGIESSPTVEGLIAKPGNGSIGVVVQTNHCEITPEAKKIFLTAKREGGSFAPFMLTLHKGEGLQHGKSSFGWVGNYLNACETKDVLIGRDCNREALDDMVLVSDMEIPEEFKNGIDEMIQA